VEKYILDNGGKRLRPALVLLASKVAFSTYAILEPAPALEIEADSDEYALPSIIAAQDKPESNLPDMIISFAAAAELIHTATLVHDDLMAGALLRRGHKTVNAGWGDEVAVLLGDHLYLKATELLTGEDMLVSDKSEYSKRFYRASNYMFKTAASILKGEILQYQKRNNLSTTEEEYFSIIQGKSASFTSACCKIGALLDENTYPGVDENLANYGLNLGIAFQIRDDILDLMGDEERIGKEVGSDLVEGRITLPLIHLMANASDGDGKYLKSILKSLSSRKFSILHPWRGRFNTLRTKSHLKRIRRMLLDHGSIDYSLDTANRFVDMAKENLKTIPDSAAKQSLINLAHYVMTREN
jgi:geranylgeranyl pyrophosphate synthase